MKSRIKEKAKIRIIKEYSNGSSVSSICNKYSISKSTLYYWVKLYKSQRTEKGITITPKELDSAKRRIKKLEDIINVLSTVDCNVSSPLKTKLKSLESLYGQYSVHTLCEALHVSRGSFYNYMLRNKRDNSWFNKRREDLKLLIQTIYDDSNQIFGVGKIRAALVGNGYIVSEKIVSELMHEMGLHSIRISSKKDNRILKRDEKRVNVLQRKFNVSQLNKVWVSDITCYKFKEIYFYICVFVDLFSRKVLSLSIGKNNSTHLVKIALTTAYNDRRPKEGLIIHTDRGAPYTSYSTQNLAKTYGIIQSYSDAGKPHDNAVVESFFATLKKEELYRSRYKSVAEFKESIKRYVIFYNTVRLHKFLNYKTPEQAESTFWKITE